MNSEDQTAPPPGVAVVTTPEVAQPQAHPVGTHRRKRRRHRNRKRHRHRHRNRNRTLPTAPPTTPPTVEDRPPVTEGTQLHQARQNHSTYDRDLHHRGKGGTGYGYRRDVTQPESELRGDQLPPAILPSYERNLQRIAQQKTPQDTPAESDSE